MPARQPAGRRRYFTVQARSRIKLGIDFTTLRLTFHRSTRLSQQIRPWGLHSGPSRGRQTATTFVEPAGRPLRITPQGTVSLRRAPRDQQEADR